MAGVSPHSVPRVSRLLPMGQAVSRSRLQTLDVSAALGRAFRRSPDRDCFRTLLAVPGKHGEALGVAAGQLSEGMGKSEQWTAREG